MDRTRFEIRRPQRGTYLPRHHQPSTRLEPLPGVQRACLRP